MLPSDLTTTSFGRLRRFLEAVGDHGSTAIQLLADHPPCLLLAGDQPALKVAREPIGTVRRLLEHTDALTGRVFHPPVIMDITEQQIPTLLPPYWPFDRS